MDHERKNTDASAGRRARGARRALLLGIVGLLGTGVLAAAVLWNRGEGRADDAFRQFPVAGYLPPDFWTDRSPEASAFRSACSQCHALPSPDLYDEHGWEAIADKMDRVIRERGLGIPRRQVDLAIAYAVENTRRSPGEKSDDSTFGTLPLPPDGTNPSP